MTGTTIYFSYQELKALYDFITYLQKDENLPDDEKIFAYWFQRTASAHHKLLDACDKCNVRDKKK